MNIWAGFAKLKRNSKLPFRNLLNSMYWDPGTVIIHCSNFDYLSVDGCKFHANDQVDSVQKVTGNTWFRGIQKGDVALDIGANIGSISIPLVLKGAKKVYAVEPLYFQELQANFKLNGIEDKTNILVWALGPKGSLVDITFASKSKLALCFPFEDFKKIVIGTEGHLDFLKVDCEGAEWGIKPEETKGIRELRFEFHIRRSHEISDLKKLEEWKSYLKTEGYNIIFEEAVQPSPMVAFTHCYLLNASKSSNV
jgi:FkbM family methyltransferase